MLTVVSARRLLARSFARSASATPGLDARLLVEGCLGLEKPDPDMQLPAEALARLRDFATRRLAGEPVWRILGEREFWGLRFRLSPATLEPRPDSETIVEATLAALAGRRAGVINPARLQRAAALVIGVFSVSIVGSAVRLSLLPG